jgi:hypothetical protein
VGGAGIRAEAARELEQRLAAAGSRTRVAAGAAAITELAADWRRSIT